MVEAEGDEAVSRRKEFNDVDQANDLSIIVGIGRELIMLLKCIFSFGFFSASCDCICCSQACLN